MEEIRKCWKVPYIVYYCSLLEQTLDLIDLRVDEFEEAIVDDSGNERNIIILHLLQKLLKPFVNRTIDLTNFESSLLSVLKKHEEEKLFLDNKEINHWNDLTILKKIDIIHMLCELRLQLSDIEAKFNDIEPNCLRIEPIGTDSNENKLWYFGDLRLYEERVSKTEKKTPFNTPNRKSSNKRGKNNNKNEAVEEVIDLRKLKDDNIDWHCVCVTLDDWNEFTLKFKKSRKKQDQELYKILEENYLNEMPELFHKAEKERQQRLIQMAPKRTSSRLEMKRTTTNINYSEVDNKDNSTENNIPIVADKLGKEDLSKQREERLKLREIKKEMINISDDTSQVSSVSDVSTLRSSDFNARNYVLMKKVLNKILTSKYAWPFKSAVTEDEAPDYKTIVEHPIDLSIIQTKVNNKSYKSREQFREDLQLIVSNCCLYNGVDSFYGKFVLKFESFYKRWLQIIYPREISNSFEEKNRLLLKLNKSTSTSAAVAAATNEEEEDEENDVSTLEDNENNKTTNPDDNSVVNNNDENTDNDVEPEFITKRTQSGRLVKMKVSTDYNYESDEDEDKKKKRKNKYYSDDEFVAGKNKKVNNDSGSENSETSFKRKSTRQRRKKLNSDDEDEIDVSDKLNETSDEDYNSDNSSIDGTSKKVQHKSRGRKRKSRIDELLNSDDYTSSNDGSNSTSKKLTFDQYIKILTGNSNGPSNSTSTSTITTSTSTNASLSSTAVANASKLINNINIDKLKVPIINPVVTAVLEANKMKQQQQHDESAIHNISSNSDNDISSTNMFNNVDNLSKSIQIIAMPSLSTPNSKVLSPNNGNNKRLMIINNNCVSQSTPTTPVSTNINSPSVLTSSSLNLVKIINLSQPQQQQQHNFINTNPIKIVSQTPTTIVKTSNQPPITPISRKIIVINNNQQNINIPQNQQVTPVQVLTKISSNTNSASPTQLIKITTNQNSQPNIQTITKLIPTTVTSTSILP